MSRSLSIADRLAESVPLELGGRTWPLLITYGVLLDCEEATGADMLGSVASIVTPSGKALQALLWAAVKRCGSGWSLRDLGAYLTLRKLPIVRDALLRAFVASMPKHDPKIKADSSGGKRDMTWPQTYAAARFELRLSDDEFLAMTPALFHEFRACHVRQLQREELMFSRLTAQMINISRYRPRTPLADDAFMVNKFPKKEAPPLTGEMIAAQMAIFKQPKQ